MKNWLIFNVATGGAHSVLRAEEVHPEPGDDAIEVPDETWYAIVASEHPHTWRVSDGAVERKALLSLAADSFTLPADGVSVVTVTAVSKIGREPVLWVNGLLAPPDTWDQAAGHGQLAITASLPGDIKVMAAPPGPPGSGDAGDPWHYSDPDVEDGFGGTGPLILNAEVPSNAN